MTSITGIPGFQARDRNATWILGPSKATGGAAGAAYNAAKLNPTFGKLAMGAEAGLDAAIKASDDTQLYSLVD